MMNRADKIVLSDTFLCEGNYAKVMLGTFGEKTVACKVFFTSRSTVKEVENEFQFMRQHHSDYLLQAYEMQLNPLIVCMEWMERGDLFGLIGKKKLSWDILFQLIEQIFLGLHWMHSNGWVHRDIKLENILIDINFNAKLGDFGSLLKANYPPLRSETSEGTPLCMAPELLTKQTIDRKKADIYSAGVTFIDMLNPSEFYLRLYNILQYRDAENQLRALYKFSPFIPAALSATLNETKDLPEGMAILLRDCTNPNPTQRPSTQMILDRLQEMQVSYFSKRKKELPEISSLPTQQVSDQKIKTDKLSPYQGIFFYRAFEARHIAWISQLPIGISEQIEQYVSGPKLSLATCII